MTRCSRKDFISISLVALYNITRRDFTKHCRMTFLSYIRISNFHSHLDRQTTKNNEMTHACIADSDQPGHLHPDWSVFAVRIKEPWIISYLLSAQQRLWSDRADVQLIRVFAGCAGNFVGLVTVWLLFSFKASLTFKCMIEHLFADFSYSIALDTYL